jgi:hypothetical protein
MPRPPYFGDRTPKVVGFLSKISEFSLKKKTTISLTQMASRLVAEFDLPPQDPKDRAACLRKAPKNLTPEEAGHFVDVQRIRHVVFKLCKKHAIWFGQEF